MSRTDDGDLIRALGYLILYSGYLEFHIEELLKSFNDFGLNDYNVKWPISKKIESAKEKFQKLKDALCNDNVDKETLAEDIVKLEETIDMLDECLELVKQRNMFVHGYIYTKGNKEDKIRSIRTSSDENYINSKIIYEVANKLFDLQNEVNSKIIGLNMYSFSSIRQRYKRLTTRAQE